MQVAGMTLPTTTKKLASLMDRQTCQDYQIGTVWSKQLNTVSRLFNDIITRTHRGEETQTNTRTMSQHYRGYKKNQPKPITTAIMREYKSKLGKQHVKTNDLTLPSHVQCGLFFKSELIQFNLEKSYHQFHVSLYP